MYIVFRIFFFWSCLVKRVQKSYVFVEWKASEYFHQQWGFGKVVKIILGLLASHIVMPTFKFWLHSCFQLPDDVYLGMEQAMVQTVVFPSVMWIIQHEFLVPVVSQKTTTTKASTHPCFPDILHNSFQEVNQSIGR